MQSKGSRLFAVGTAITAAATAFTYSSYKRAIAAARRRIESEGQIIDADTAPIEFAEAGDGPAAFVIHGAGGGFDQGLELGRALLGDAYRVVAPSRFGYLGTPMPRDASPDAQAESHLRLMDALKLEHVPVIGVSAGAPSAMQLCLKHPDRCAALVLVAPMVWAPDRTPSTDSARFGAVLNAIASSDFLFWSATKVATMTLLETILGTPAEVYHRATLQERRLVERMLATILPISRRMAGIRNDSAVSSSLQRYELEAIRVPTMIVSAADDRYQTYESSFYTAEEITDARFIGFPHGGHLLLGHEAEVQRQIMTFLAQYVEAKKLPRVAV
jgi:pimeloyl-ACP methyl ester carboxylesterase